MSDFNRGISRPTPAVADMGIDAGLRSFMLGVYNKVALGLVLSAALAWVTGNYQPVKDVLYPTGPDGIARLSMWGMILAVAPIGILLSQMFMRRSSPQVAAVVYWSIVSLIGASLGVIFLIYNDVSIFETFLATAVAFGALSIVGYTTKRDLTGIGTFLTMGLFGLIGASVLNLFFHSQMLFFLVNLFGVLIFAGLTAFHTQQLKMTYYRLGGDQTAMSVATNYGALSLYLDFVNLFQFLLYFMGGSRR